MINRLSGLSKFLGSRIRIPSTLWRLIKSGSVSVFLSPRYWSLYLLPFVSVLILRRFFSALTFGSTGEKVGGFAQAANILSIFTDIPVFFPKYLYGSCVNVLPL